MNTKPNSVLAAWIVTARNRLLDFDGVVKAAYERGENLDNEIAALQAYPIPLEPQPDEPAPEDDQKGGA